MGVLGSGENGVKKFREQGARQVLTSHMWMSLGWHLPEEYPNSGGRENIVILTFLLQKII